MGLIHTSFDIIFSSLKQYLLAFYRQKHIFENNIFDKHYDLGKPLLRLLRQKRYFFLVAKLLPLTPLLVAGPQKIPFFAASLTQ